MLPAHDSLGVTQNVQQFYSERLQSLEKNSAGDLWSWSHPRASICFGKDPGLLRRLWNTSSIHCPHKGFPLYLFGFSPSSLLQTISFLFMGAP